MTSRCFIRHGPAIPTELLHALEEDRLVLFCGAGVSMGTGLPNFPGLVKAVVQAGSHAVDEHGVPSDLAARDAFCTHQHDKVLEIMERNEPAESYLMRRAVMRRLLTPIESPTALELHEALLQLARRRPGPGQVHPGYHLVTTNFDDRFELAGLRISWIEQAPRLSPPSRRGLVNVVYLHGRIDITRPEAERTGVDLVLTSADFGNAYLRDGWAARFVVELLREFTVLFIGYSLNDPVMRYLMDALAADRRSEGQFRTAYAIADYSVSEEGHKEQQQALWTAKNVIPVLYPKDHPEHPGHALLRETIIAWAKEYSAGQNGRLTLALSSTATPFVYGQNDESDPLGVAAAAWALSEPSGAVARLFATAEPAPQVSWLAPLLREEIRDPCDPNKICRLVDLKEVAKPLAQWVCRCLASEEAAEWAVADQDGMFPELKDRLPWALTQTEPSRLVPEPYDRFWRIILRLHSQALRLDAGWHDALPSVNGRLTDEGCEILLARLHPRMSVRMPWRFMPSERPEPVARLSQLATIEVQLACEYPNLIIVEALKKVTDDPESESRLLADLADDITSALLEHLRFGATAELPFATGASHRQREQIAAPLDEVNHDDWRILVDLLVASVVRGRNVVPDFVEPVCRRWHVLWLIHGYSLFLRLWLFAVSEWARLDLGAAVDLLLGGPEHLWGHELRAEVLRLLARRGAEIDSERLARLASKLGAGPPRTLFSEDLDDEDLAEHSTAMVDARLAALAEAGVELPGISQERQRAAARAVQELRDSFVRDGFPVGEHGTPLSTSRGGWVEGPSVESIAARPVAILAKAIISYRDEWGSDRDADDLLAEFVRREPTRAVEISEELVRQGEQRASVWDGLWRGLWNVVDFEQVSGLASDLDALAGRHDLLVRGESILSVCRLTAKLAGAAADEGAVFSLWDRARVVALEHGSSGLLSDTDDLDRAINAPGGVLAEALLSLLAKASQEAGASFPAEIGTRLDQLAGDNGAMGRYARIVLTSRLRWMHHLNPEWTRRTLISRMQW